MPVNRPSCQPGTVRHWKRSRAAALLHGAAPGSRRCARCCRSDGRAAPGPRHGCCKRCTPPRATRGHRRRSGSPAPPAPSTSPASHRAVCPWPHGQAVLALNRKVRPVRQSSPGGSRHRWHRVPLPRTASGPCSAGSGFRESAYALAPRGRHRRDGNHEACAQPMPAVPDLVRHTRSLAGPRRPLQTARDSGPAARHVR